MLNILLIVTFAFLNPALPDNPQKSDQPLDVNSLFEQLKDDNKIETKRLNKDKSKRIKFLTNACNSIKYPPLRFIEEFSKEHRINPNSIKVQYSVLKTETSTKTPFACSVTTVSDAGLCNHDLQITYFSPFKILGLSNVQCK